MCQLTGYQKACAAVCGVGGRPVTLRIRWCSPPKLPHVFSLAYITFEAFEASGLGDAASGTIFRPRDVSSSINREKYRAVCVADDAFQLTLSDVSGLYCIPKTGSCAVVPPAMCCALEWQLCSCARECVGTRYVTLLTAFIMLRDGTNYLCTVVSAASHAAVVRR